MVLLCEVFFLFFLFFLEREKSEGGAQNSLSPSLRTESDSFSPKKIRKNVSNQSSLHVTFLLLNRRARSNAPFEHAQKHTHKKRSRETLDCLRFKTVSSEVTARSPFKK